MNTLTIELDQLRCEGHGLCEEAAPDLMHLDGEGDLVLDVAQVEDGTPQGRAAAAAVRVCPVAALRLA